MESAYFNAQTRVAAQPYRLWKVLIINTPDAKLVGPEGAEARVNLSAWGTAQRVNLKVPRE